MRNIILIAVLIVVGLVGYFAFAPTPANPDMPFKIDGAFARVNSKSSTAGAAFFTLHNQSGQDDRLIGAKTDVAAMVELHTHKEDADGIMMMRPIEGGIPVASGANATLQRGGDHLMLMGLTKPLEDGETITVTLTFEKAGDVQITIPVNSKN